MRSFFPSEVMGIFERKCFEVVEIGTWFVFEVLEICGTELNVLPLPIALELDFRGTFIQQDQQRVGFIAANLKRKLGTRF